MFTSGQAYTAISRCTKWNHIQIINLNRDSFIKNANDILDYPVYRWQLDGD
ncbi:hypothetical protein C1645_841789 [Glomus cerebriforme]|uniref:Uncharacterized protein n=1 Tax=Glomus cerebriforme TaxID=658196 RepID=A0A397RXH2_9GLOM|nr:hypothetical protein C1645_841789 [Glomus cerebriforme]